MRTKSGEVARARRRLPARRPRISKFGQTGESSASTKMNSAAPMTTMPMYFQISRRMPITSALPSEILRVEDLARPVDRADHGHDREEQRQLADVGLGEDTPHLGQKALDGHEAQGIEEQDQVELAALALGLGAQLELDAHRLARGVGDAPERRRDVAAGALADDERDDHGGDEGIV